LTDVWELTRRGCGGALRARSGELIKSLGIPLDFLLSTAFVCTRELGESSLKAIFALKMTFDPISYVYIPTVPRSKSTKSGHRTTKNGGTASKKSQHIQPGATALVMLDSLRPSVVEAAERNGGESRVQGEVLVLVFLYETMADGW
jgi:hypothetical protein